MWDESSGFRPVVILRVSEDLLDVDPATSLLLESNGSDDSIFVAPDVEDNVFSNPVGIPERRPDIRKTGPNGLLYDLVPAVESGDIVFRSRMAAHEFAELLSRDKMILLGLRAIFAARRVFLAQSPLP
jgi:hypothetical protein